jgi:hypothetical protein
MIKKLMAGSLFCAALLTGCATVKMSSVAMDTQAKTFSVKPGKANIYFYRDWWFSGIELHGVELDGKPMGETTRMTYFMFEVEPGKHTLVSIPMNDPPLELEVKPGKNYFVQQLFFPMGRTGLAVNDEEEGKVSVLKCQLLEIQPGK